MRHGELPRHVFPVGDRRDGRGSHRGARETRRGARGGAGESGARSRPARRAPGRVRAVSRGRVHADADAVRAPLMQRVRRRRRRRERARRLRRGARGFHPRAEGPAAVSRVRERVRDAARASAAGQPDAAPGGAAGPDRDPAELRAARVANHRRRRGAGRVHQGGVPPREAQGARRGAVRRGSSEGTRGGGARDPRGGGEDGGGGIGGLGGGRGADSRPAGATSLGPPSAQEAAAEVHRVQRLPHARGRDRPRPDGRRGELREHLSRGDDALDEGRRVGEFPRRPAGGGARPRPRRRRGPRPLLRRARVRHGAAG